MVTSEKPSMKPLLTCSQALYASSQQQHHSLLLEIYLEFLWLGNASSTKL